jgi:hypothetical protein
MKMKTIFCGVVLALAIVFKFWLVARMEITDDMEDPVNYMSQILFCGGHCFGPGTGYFGRLLLVLGIPYRLGIETAYLAATLLAIKALFDWPIRSTLALGLYLVMIFNPAPAELFSHLMSDPVWLVEMLAGSSLFILFAGERSKVGPLMMGLAGLCLGLSTLTRNTFVPLMAGLVLWAVISGAAVWLKGGKTPRKDRIGSAWAICFYAIAIIYFGTCYTNLLFQGYFGISVFDSYQYREFYTALQSVGEPTGPPHYPIAENRRRLIAEAGPTARSTMEKIDGDVYLKKVSLRVQGAYDLAPGWFEFAVFDTLNASREQDKFFATCREIENEIAHAGKEGKIKVRHVLPLPDCRLGIVLPLLPGAMWRLAGMIPNEPSRYAWAWSANEPKFNNPWFSKALTRRAVTPSPLRERIGEALCRVYAGGYAPLPGIFAAAFGLFAGALGRRWKEIPAFCTRFLAEQFFLVVLTTLFLWYVLFDASGLVGVSRYMILHNIMLPALIFYYARHGLRLLRGDVGTLAAEKEYQ